MQKLRISRAGGAVTIAGRPCDCGRAIFAVSLLRSPRARARTSCLADGGPK
jgi:hypothetical protein